MHSLDKYFIKVPALFKRVPKVGFPTSYSFSYSFATFNEVKQISMYSFLD